MKPAYWTAADQAELEVLAWELVGTVRKHRAACEVCEAGFPPCPRVTAAVEIAVEWVRGRELRSRAEYLRHIEELAA
jgi:hypothetical protein